MRLDPISLRLFVRVVEEGTIARAAEREHIAAAAVSKRLSELEDTLRTRLLTRTNKGVEPTAAGAVLLARARGVLHDLDGIYAEMWDYASGTRGHVRVHANISAISQFLPCEIAQFRTLHPGVQIHLEEHISSDIAKAVAENAADVGVCNPPDLPVGVEVLPYRTDQLVIGTPVGHPLAARSSVRFAEALDFDFIGLHTGSSLNRLLTRAATEENGLLRMRIQVTSWDGLCRMIEANLGIGVLPLRAAEPYAETHRVCVVPLEEPWARRALCVCVRSGDALPAAARLLVDHLTASR